jgi:glycosyltransferase involved in cell wall biosynthesis
MLDRVRETRVAILLSTVNGEFFLREQLDSLLTQSHESWTLYWGDGGSSDRTVPILHDFAHIAG